MNKKLSNQETRHYSENYAPAPRAFIADIFKAKAFAKGRSMKRSQASVERLASEELLKQAVKDAGYKLAKLKGEYLLVSREEDIEWLVD